MKIPEKIGYKMMKFNLKKEWLSLRKRRGAIDWDGLVMCKGELLKNQWDIVIWFKSMKQKELEKEVQNNTSNST